ncbi:MAG: CAP domain-containing protein [Gemmataceae bacterium]
MKFAFLVCTLVTFWSLFANEPFVSGQTAELKLSKFENEVLRLTNEARKKKNLPPFKVNKSLTIAARAHSANMAKQRKLAHKLDGKGPDARVLKAGYNYMVVGENISQGTYTPKQLLDGWMKSKFHRSNILDKEFTEVGLGRAKSKAGVYYYAQVFACPLRLR